MKIKFHKLKLHLRKSGFLAFFAAALMCVSGLCYANDNDVQNLDEPATVTRIGDIESGNMGGEVHIINLYDHQDFITWPAGEPQNPFSLRITCGKCHDYETIGRGWHFNAGLEYVLDPETSQKVAVKIDPGRVSEPWIFWDCQTATQIPLSYRSWPGTYRPEQLGVSKWWFTRIFGRHLTGGGVSVRDETADLDSKDRWAVSGDLEINCLTCHSVSPSYNQSEFANQIANHNFRWAATAASGLATVTGSAKNLPGFRVPTDESSDAPKVLYHKSQFLPERKTFIDIQKKIPNKRCLSCHSTKNIGVHTDEDVHLSAGLSCVDCHRNGLDHDITRGYENGSADSKNPLAAVSSCRGCHLPDESSPVPMSGRLGAPEPLHAGIPTVHFEKLTCTACHSGPWPGKTTIRAKTSRAHALGTQNVNISDETLPHIFSPVFMPDQTGKIGPYKIFWPAFWAHLKDQQVTPIAPQIVKEAAGNILYHKLELPESATWPELTEEMITQVLRVLASENSDDSRVVYICGGKLYRLDGNGNLITSEHQAAKAYAWPIAHNVRPAAQSLGVRGCEDCHSAKQPFFFSDVEIDSPVLSQNHLVKKMTDFQDIDVAYARAFAFSFVFRPMLKVVALGSCALLAAVLLLYALKALACVVKLLAGAKPAEIIENENTEDPLAIINFAKKFIYFLVIISFAVLAVTGFGPLIFSKALTGYILMTHATFAPVFAGSLAVLVLLTVHRNRFDKNDRPLFKGPGLIRKACFWLIIILSLPVILSSVLSMFPIFGTPGQKCLLCLHRYSTIAFAVVALIHTFLIIFAGPKKANILTER